jgi:membrane carboxypeptidase/penicillin-binding protein
MTSVGGIQVFGATYPARIWAQYMKSALGESPPADFVVPNEKLWPKRQRIDEMGRGFRSYQSFDTTTTTAPVVVTPETKPTIPFIVRPTTPPPVTVPHTTPRTTPPPTAPPPTAPPPTTGP